MIINALTKAIGPLVILSLIVAHSLASDVFNMGGTRDPTTGTWTGLASLERVTVGDPHNTADTQYMVGMGSVGYVYQIGTYEVTAGQYTVFLNAVAKTDTYGLYNTQMDTANQRFGCNIKRSGSSGSYTYSVASDWANRPVNYVSFWDACRFVNWLQNGCPTGLEDNSSTEDGTYALYSYMGIDGRNIGRNPGATFVLPSYNEWYKAAYYKSGGTNSGYWKYPTKSNLWPTNELPPGHTNSANWTYDNSPPYLDPVYHTTVVGAYNQSPGPYGTYDQAGNVWEWNDTVEGQWSDQAYRGTCGGGWYQDNVDTLSAYYGGQSSPSVEAYNHGFRIASVPEPGSVALLATGAIVSLLVCASRCPRKKPFSANIGQGTAYSTTVHPF